MISLEEKQGVIQWLSQVLSHELTEKQFHQYLSGEFSPLFDGLKEAGFKDAETMLNALQSLQLEQFGHLELAADFATSFLLEGGISALPYASQYIEESEQPEHFALMDHYLEQFNLQINQETKEPSDHLCVYLELLLQVMRSEDQNAVNEFVEKALFWLPRFSEKLSHIPMKTAFYLATVRLLLAVIKA